MKVLKYLLLLQTLFIILNNVTSQWCMKTRSVQKTRTKWNDGVRTVTKLNFFGNVKYKYESYRYSTVQYYNDYDRVRDCCDGYTKNGYDCQPQCRPSCPTNTHCSRPNICECNQGYVGYSTHPTLATCRPVCASACPENSQCSKPNTCDCNVGYKKSNNGTCEPICERGCPEHSTCAKPNSCTCDTGYAYNNTSKICQPICNGQCPLKSICSKPYTCTCLPGYLMVDGQCQAICDPICRRNAACVKPNQCECVEGYEMGKTDDDSLECIPKCTDECPENAFCSKPNSCECHTGYEMSSNNTCDAVCQPTCPENSVCSAPNTCTCLKGYHMLDNQCQPICDKPCPDHSLCAQPNKCECLAGYQLKFSSIYNLYCEPQCQRNCSTFGKCVQPNKCECLPGYEMDEMEDCRPVCSLGCTNGVCHEPEVCICNPGYLMGPNNVCEPVCSMPCQNGSCVQPEICQCFEGYRLKNGSVNVCEPQCEPECVNGLCVDVNVCKCYTNYEPTTSDEGSFNYNNCQRIETTTLQVFTTKPELKSTEYELILPDTDVLEGQPRNGRIQSISENISTSLEQSQTCADMCQCWLEYDELGSLSNSQLCISPCEGAYNNTCLNMSLCRCDTTKNHLLCQTEDDPDDEPLLYLCKIQRIRLHPNKIEKAAIRQDSTKSWIIFSLVLGVCCIIALGLLIYKIFRKHEDPIEEYAL